MRLLLASPRQGAAWVRLGFAAFAQQPIAFTGLFTAFLLLAVVLAIIPVLGSVLISMLPPFMTLVFMEATQRCQQHQQLSPTLIVQTLRQLPAHRGALLKLCILYAVAMFLVVTVAHWADGGAFERLMQDLPALQKNPVEFNQRLNDPQLVEGMLLLGGLMSLVSVLFWHAPALVCWGGQGCAQAIFSSSLACWRNKGAFLIYGLTWAALLLVMVVASSVLLAVLGQARWFPMWGMLLSLILSTVFYASLYFSLVDCIRIDPEPVNPMKA